MAGKRLLIVGHVPSPNTLRLRDAAVEGAKSDPDQSIEIEALSPFDTTPEHVMAAGAVMTTP